MFRQMFLIMLTLRKLLSLNYICTHKNYLSGGDLCWINRPNSIVHYGLVFEQSPQNSNR